MKNQTKENQMKYSMATAAAAIFIVAAYNLPTETFFGFLAAGLFLIPASFFIYLVHKVAGA